MGGHGNRSTASPEVIQETIRTFVARSTWAPLQKLAGKPTFHLNWELVSPAGVSPRPSAEQGASSHGRIGIRRYTSSSVTSGSE